MSTIVIIDYGMGNLHSAAKAVARAVENSTVIISSDPAVIKKADRKRHRRKKNDRTYSNTRNVLKTRNMKKKRKY